ncbi:tetratricopeptide repeat protein [Chondrinema litorale]|uniref:tetratricopeptide repeat protein n=1 Tax=Chondrinema litorale TaxID=2994555 RepID=UPI0025427EC7|nr:tetratricopeptide repeat protein [Chondrinema litorale]UZR96007.1 tetratricopeptide repeat protein [Chondrinema litorale]
MKFIYILSTFLFLLISNASITYAQENTLALANEYYSNNELEKAIELYEKLLKKDDNIAAVHKNYLDALFKLQDFKEADKYLKRILKYEPLNAQYNVDYGRYLTLSGSKEKAEDYYDEYLEKIKRENNQLRYAAIYFINEKQFEYAEKAFMLGRKNDKYDFYQELADLYSNWGKKELMLQEYMSLLMFDDSQLEYVETMLQDRITDEEEFDNLETELIQAVQKNPDKTVYNELLIWYFLQKNDFYKAFIQARAVDKRQKLDGFKIMEIGRLALNNASYKDAIRIFEYLVEKYNDKPVYSISRRMLINAKEQLVKNTYPVDQEKIKSLALDYDKIIQELGINRNTADAVRSMALLQAFYLNNKDTAVTILENLIQLRGMKPSLISEAKLDLGDIYLLKGEPWEASLLYSQVEKAEKDQNLGHIAKLKNAKLSYYKGEFELARAHLDVLKLATSREIANDAMDLSLLIQDNLDLDTSATVMSEYAEIDLLVFQSHFEEALDRYKQLLKAHKDHSLADEIMWESANILMKLGRFEEAVVYLEDILKDHAFDILGDDANFTLGKIEEDYMHNSEKAQEIYTKQLKDYPGSIFNVEARKRLRKLRGDNLN